MPKHHPHHHIPLGANNFLSVLEGIEGGFAIFVGIVAGLSFSHISRDLLILTAVISIVVNAINASAVRYTSEHYLDELDGHEKRSWFKAYFLPSAIVFLTYLVVSLIAVLPLVFIHDQIVAIWSSVLLTAVILFGAGLYRGWLIIGRHALRDGIEVMNSGLLIIIAGTLSGWILSLILA